MKAEHNKWLGGALLPWNHPLRLDAERMVQRWNDYAQTHDPDDNKRELAEMVVEFVRTHQISGEGL